MRRLLVLTTLMITMITLCPVSVGQLKEIKDLLGKLNQLRPLIVSDKEVGLLFADGIAKKHGIDNNPDRNNRVLRIGGQIISSNQIRNPYDFAVLASNDFNACSIFGGHIRVYEGLLSDTQNNDNEAAFAIAHEIAHNELGHNKEAVNNFKVTYALDLSRIKQRLPQLLTLASEAVLAKRSRENETKADFRALELMEKAGFNSTGAIAMARRIEAEHTIAQKKSGNQNFLEQRFNGIFDTHPEPAKRADMAEDYYFLGKYNSTFKNIAGASTNSIDSGSNSIFGSCPIIVAHPSLWVPQIIDITKISGVGVFNPFGSEKTDVDFYLNVCKTGNLVAVTCDNDSHDKRSGSGEGTANRFTFIQCDNPKTNDLVSAVRLAKTYASHDGTEISQMNFEIGKNFPNISRVNFTFRINTGNPKVTAYRDGEKIGTYFANNGAYSIDDPEAEKGRHWYVLYSPGRFITSPITVNVTGNRRDKESIDTTTWQKGLIHYHSYYSDGNTKSIQQIWNASQQYGVKYIFMTDHADKFENKDKYQRYADDCARASVSSMIPGIEYVIGNKALMNHLLVLSLDPNDFQLYKQMDKNEFFDGSDNSANQVCIIKDQFHIGDDNAQDTIIKDATFKFSQASSTLKMWIKGSPFKDPIIWINRHEVGRVVTTDDKWHLFTFQVPAQYLNNGANLYHMESYIPDRRLTFDDCEVKDIWIVKN